MGQTVISDKWTTHQPMTVILNEVKNLIRLWLGINRSEVVRTLPYQSPMHCKNKW